MSSHNEGDEEFGAEPTAQFDAFRARRDDDRAQQETQSAYVFPEEYAAGPEQVFPPQEAPMPQYGDYGQEPPMPPYGDYGAGMPVPDAPKRKWRSIAVFGGAVLVAGALGVGVWAAFDSGSPSTGNTSAGTTATGSATAGATNSAGKRAKDVLTFRVTIASIGADSFTGTVLANDENVTVDITAKTHFGTKAHAFDRADLAVGETVIVRGHRTGTSTVTATVVAANTTASTAAGGGASPGAAA